MRYDVLALLVAERCNFRCDHCCTESDGNATGTLSLDDALRAIDQAAAIPSMHEVALTGGEPFLDRTRLQTIVRHAHARGLSVSVTTNGYWARDPEHAARLLRALQDDGLRCISISVSQFHLPFTSAERLRCAAEAAWNVGLTTRINCIYTNSFTVDDATSLFGELAAKLEVVAIPCIPAGRAALAVAPADFPVRADAVQGSCAKHFTKLAVSTTGDVYPCCSPGGFTEALRLGNICRDDVSTLHERAERSTLLRTLNDVGPEFFMPFVAEQLRHDALVGPFVDQCHLCHTILSDDRMRAIAVDAAERLHHDLSIDTASASS
ncbi:MAG: hypothetical protein QOI11_1844 [Candidatus Eremiobacteraeota bacterium]|jgi:MoaA/NifB/PqqE/SkfB family radical SAM enzyme|nr:hypothetical protein [Candidatus Eremiobacteraeota bacterium]